jgi:NitT/TauT family transport system substrate-binding protein
MAPSACRRLRYWNDDLEQPELEEIFVPSRCRGSTLFSVVLALGLAVAMAAPAMAEPPVKVRLGQAVPALAFLPIYAARALDTFTAEGISLEWAAIPGGDPTTLAALDAGDIDLAAVGSETPLVAYSKGAPYEIIYSLMSRMSLELTVSRGFLERTGVLPGDPIEKRVAALKGATIGVSAIRGTQERVARWLVGRFGGDSQHDLNAANIGVPTALRAALEHNAIDAYLLSTPEGALAEEAGVGKVLIRLGSDLEELRQFHHLVLAVKKDWAEKNAATVVKVARALIAASRRTVEDPAMVAAAIQQKFFPKVAPAILAASVASLKGGVADNGRMTEASIAFLIKFSAATGAGLDKPLDAAKGEDVFWTNRYVDAALKP